MKMLKELGLAACLCTLAGSAAAQEIESVTMTSDPDDIVFTVRADAPLSTPSVRTYEGSIRVRFPESSAPDSLQVRGDGAAIKLVDFRSGSHDSSVMRIDLGEASKLAAEDIRIENRRHVFVVRIARDLLPPMREPRVQEPEKQAALPVAAALRPASPAEPAAAPVPAKSTASQPAAAKPQSKLLQPKANTKDTPLATAMAAKTDSSPMPMLLAVSAILAIAYAALRLVMKKQQRAPGQRVAAAIDIVAQKRLGPRHQLVIVRAFGREHLLSIQGGTTTPIATSEEIDHGAAIMARSELLASAPLALRSGEALREEKKEEETAFGGELLRVALAQRLKENAPKALDDARPRKDEKGLSEAVAGLVRLRRDAGLQ
jgi:flagellar biogenesis protein FliO